MGRTASGIWRIAGWLALPVLIFLSVYYCSIRNVLKEHVWIAGSSCDLVDRLTKRSESNGYTRIVGLKCGERFDELATLDYVTRYAIASSTDAARPHMRIVTFSACELPAGGLRKRADALNKRTAQTGYAFTVFTPAPETDCNRELDSLPGRITPHGDEPGPPDLSPDPAQG
jgi:hypothetical protein